MKRNKLIIWIPLLIAVTFIAGLYFGSGISNSQKISENDKFNSILNLINNEYVDHVNMDSLIEETIPELLSHLDPHSTYIPAKDLKAVNDELDGSFSGIGISFMLNNDTISIIEVLSGGPSEKVGLMPGDRIVSVDDSIVAGKNFTNEKVLSILRGEKGSQVKLGIKRNTAKETLHFDLIRDDIPVTSVDAAYIIAPEIGYIKVNKFGRTTYNEFLTSMTQLRNEGAKKYILDLRGNGGGFMEMAILMANEFLSDNDIIVFTKGRTKRESISTVSDGNGSFLDSEVVVLIDEYSASASEILAGAIQDNDRGLIIGRRSFGKGLVQRQTELPDSSALRLTVSRYHTPSGRCIQKEYTPGKTDDYGYEIINRYNHGEAFNADSIKLNKSLEFTTAHGRKVYGGGGIMPDVFVPNDTSKITNYYIKIANAGLLQKFAFDYCDSNRNKLNESEDANDLLNRLPDDESLLQSFVKYATQNGIPARWYYINISSPLIVNQLKSLIARDILGSQSFYHIYNTQDNCVQKAISELQKGNAKFPIMPKDSIK
ncbi:MAG: S41 family peptidase [Muribaculaceae bacterium]|nr:S41 family peptidase [Muribaculaceae bacterium]